MWAVGCIFFNLLSGYAPFDEGIAIATLLRIFKTCGTPSPQYLVGAANHYPELNRMCPNLLNCVSFYPQWPAISLSELFGDGLSAKAIILLD
jgi:serine/threonine protein kinase